MVDPSTLRRYGFRALFFGVCTLVIFIKLVPLTTMPARIPGPDLLFAFTAAFLMRRPRYTPILLIVFLHLIADILFLRPLGLWPAIALLGFEFLRRQVTGHSEIEWPLEIVLVPVVFGAMMAVNATVYMVLSIPHPTLAATLLHILMTALFYPVVLLVTHFVLKVRRPRPGDLELEEAHS